MDYDIASIRDRTLDVCPAAIITESTHDHQNQDRHSVPGNVTTVPFPLPSILACRLPIPTRSSLSLRIQILKAVSFFDFDDVTVARLIDRALTRRVLTPRRAHGRRCRRQLDWQ